MSRGRNQLFTPAAAASQQHAEERKASDAEEREANPILKRFNGDTSFILKPLTIISSTILGYKMFYNSYGIGCINQH